MTKGTWGAALSILREADDDDEKERLRQRYRDAIGVDPRQTAAGKPKAVPRTKGPEDYTTPARGGDAPVNAPPETRTPGTHDVGQSQKQYQTQVDPSHVSDRWEDPDRPNREKGEKGIGVGTPTGQPLPRAVRNPKTGKLDMPRDPRIQQAKKGRGEGLPPQAIVAMQKEVNKLWNKGMKDRSDALARQLGVPTADERVQQNPESPNYGKPDVWVPERVFRWRETGSDLQNAPPEQHPGGFETQPRQGDIDVKGGELGPVTTSDLVKMGILRPRTGVAPVGAPKRPPNFDGERVQPAGQSRDVVRSFPNKATGNFSRASGQTDPSKEGQEWIGLFADANGEPTRSGEYNWFTKEQFLDILRKNPELRSTLSRERAGRRQAGPDRREVSKDQQAQHREAGDTDLIRKVMGSPELRRRLAADFGLDAKTMQPNTKDGRRPGRAEFLNWAKRQSERSDEE